MCERLDEVAGSNDAHEPVGRSQGATVPRNRPRLAPARQVVKILDGWWLHGCGNEHGAHGLERKPGCRWKPGGRETATATAAIIPADVRRVLFFFKSGDDSVRDGAYCAGRGGMRAG